MYRQQNRREDIYKLSYKQRRKWVGRLKFYGDAKEVDVPKLAVITALLSEVVDVSKMKSRKVGKEHKAAVDKFAVSVQEAQDRNGPHLGSYDQNEEEFVESMAVKEVLKQYESASIAEQGSDHRGMDSSEQMMAKQIDEYVRELEDAKDAMDTEDGNESKTRTVKCEELAFFDEDFGSLSTSAFTATVPMDTTFAPSDTITEQTMSDDLFERTTAMVQGMSIEDEDTVET